MTSSLREIIGGAGSLEAFAREYPGYVAEVMERVDPAAIGRFAEILLDADAAGGTIYFAGNGGSSAQAAHFANDMVLGTRRAGMPGLRATSLSENAAILTAAANDTGYENTFVLQIEGRLDARDVLVALSASGNSENLVRAVAHARDAGATTVGLLGFDGGRLLELVDHAVLIPTETGEYGPVEDGFSLLDHLLTAYIAEQREAGLGQTAQPAGATPP